MADFSYTAKNVKGEVVKGIYEAARKSDVENMLRQKGYFSVAVQSIASSKNVKELGFLNKVTLKDISIFCKQFSILVSAGLPLVQTLDILAKQSTKRNLKRDIEEINEDVRKGKSLAASFKSKKSFPVLLSSMVEVGETGGTLERVLKSMMTHYEKENKLQTKIKTAMTYPIAVLVVTLGVVYFLLTSVVPMFVGMFTGAGLALPWPTRVLLNLSAFINANGLFLFLFIMISVLLFRMAISNTEGRFRWHRFLLRIPLVSKLISLIISARFTRTMAILLSTGVPLVDALDMTGRVLANAVAERAMKSMQDSIKLGNALWVSLYQTNLFPSMVVHMIRIGEESGSIDEVLEKTATFYDDETETFLMKLTALMEPVMIVILGVIVGFVVLSIALPMFDMLGTIS